VVSPRVNSSRRSRFIGRLALATKAFSKANSPLVSPTTWPSFDNWRLARSNSQLPKRVTPPSGSGAAGVRTPRRSTASMRATQFAGVERLANVVVGTRLQADHPVDGFVACGEHDDRSRLAARAQAAAGGETVFAGKHQVEHQQLRLIAFEKGIELAGIGQQQRVEAMPTKIGGEQLAQLGVVVNKQDFLHGPGRSGNGHHSMLSAVPAWRAETICNRRAGLAKSFAIGPAAE
jgi:hypothetical protein